MDPYRVRYLKMFTYNRPIFLQAISAVFLLVDWLYLNRNGSQTSLGLKMQTPILTTNFMYFME